MVTDNNEQKSDMKIVLEAIGRLQECFVSVSGGLVELNGDMSAEFAAVRSEMKSEFVAVRAEMKSEFAAVRGEMKSGFAGVNKELKRQDLEIRKNGVLLEDLNHKFELVIEQY